MVRKLIVMLVVVVLPLALTRAGGSVRAKAFVSDQPGVGTLNNLPAKMNGTEDDGFKWWNPAGSDFGVIEGQGWPEEVVKQYDRFPARVKEDVREVVWSKSEQSTGLLLRFRTDAPEIRVRYHVTGDFAFEHMPATGVSGVDLYARGANGDWRWTGGNYVFADTVHFEYPSLGSHLREYFLYLPLYNKVSWLEIGVAAGASFTPLRARTEKPIVVYGTSIVQGGCASRPGMAWTAQLGRNLDAPVINLGFSSNGLLEKPVIELLAGLDARVYILDCLPNMRSLPDSVIRSRTFEAVKYLQERRPDVPIVFAENASEEIHLMDAAAAESIKKVNVLMRSVFAEMKAAGVGNIYLLTGDEIGFNNESTVDGHHPTDMGMSQYASAYTKQIRAIFSRGQNTQGSNDDATWLGFVREDFTVEGRSCILIKPERAAPGNPWIWRTEFFGHEPQADSALATLGFHVAYMDLTDMYGSPPSLDLMDAFYQYLIQEAGLHGKPVLEGFSRGGLFALNWAARNPAKVSALYLDAPVCDFKSWPGGKGKGKGSEADWKKLKEAYGFRNNRQALRYRFNPVDNLRPLAKYDIPILSICGTADPLVPIEENTGLVEERYHKLGGTIEVIRKEGVGHHPHSLHDPTPIVEFVIEAVRRAGVTLPDYGYPDIGSRLELFIDDYLIERLEGKAVQRLHHPQPRELVIKHDTPWEGPGSGYHSVFQDDEGYKLYYKCWNRDVGPEQTDTIPDSFFLGYAESRDGIHWTKPPLGLHKYSDSKANNIVMTADAIAGLHPDPGHPAVFLDQNPTAAPDARYKAVIRAWSPAGGVKGLLAFKSGDGVHWSLMHDKPIITNGAFDSQNLAFWDAHRGEYRAYWRIMKPGGIRAIRTGTSKDFLHWGEFADVSFENPVAGEEFYTSQIKPYYRAPHIFIGFPVRYIDRGWSASMKALPDPAHRDWRSSIESRLGTALTESLLISSRDGVHFNRWREAFLRPGIERSGTWSYGQQYIAWHVVETASSLPGAPRELSLYASENYWSGEKGSALRRYTLRMDGFVSVSASKAGGALVTKPFTFSGDALVLNFSSAAGGDIRVEIQNVEGKPLAGFALEDCEPVFGDSIDRKVIWKNNAGLRALAGKPVRLRFVLSDADLYSFRFQ